MNALVDLSLEERTMSEVVLEELFESLPSKLVFTQQLVDCSRVIDLLQQQRLNVALFNFDARTLERYIGGARGAYTTLQVAMQEHDLVICNYQIDLVNAAIEKDEGFLAAYLTHSAIEAKAPDYEYGVSKVAMHTAAYCLTGLKYSKCHKVALHRDQDLIDALRLVSAANRKVA